MAKAADIGGKRLIGLSPDAWVQWATNLSGVAVQEMVSADFQWISRESDVLLRARSPQLGEFLVLNGLQLRYKKRIPKRIRAYAGLASARVAYSQGTLEIMSPLPKHERAKGIIGDLVKILLEELQMDCEPFGSTTFKSIISAQRLQDIPVTCQVLLYRIAVGMK